MKPQMVLGPLSQGAPEGLPAHARALSLPQEATERRQLSTSSEDDSPEPTQNPEEEMSLGPATPPVVFC